MVSKLSGKEARNRESIAKAIAGLQDGTYKTPHKASKATGAPIRTLYRRVNGTKSIIEPRTSQQLLSPHEEQALVGWVLRAAATGHPVTHSFLRELAEEIRKPRVESENTIVPPLGKDWTNRFMRRNPQLKTAMAQGVEFQRKEVTKEILDKWFAEFKRILEEYGIDPENTYNMNDTGFNIQRVLFMLIFIGFSIGTRGAGCVIVSSSEKQAYRLQPGRQEWVTVIECICGDGTAISPLIIFKGENLQTAWIPKDMDTSWKFTCNTKGWTSDNIGKEWFTQCFEPATSAKANGKKRLLVCDGHGNHISAQTIAFCMQHNIELLLMPPHSLHICQPLDVGVFSSLKQAMTNELDNIMRYGVSTIEKFEWADAYRLARPKAFTESNIKSGWSETGLIPFNRRRVIVGLHPEASPEPDDLLESESTELPSCPFSNIPETPSKLDSAALRIANRMLLDAINASDLGTPTKRYASFLTSLTEDLQARCTASEYQFNQISRIVKRRKEGIFNRETGEIEEPSRIYDF